MSDAPSDFEGRITPLHVRAREIHQCLARAGLRTFCISIKTGQPTWYWIHDHKTVAEWREDLREFIAASTTDDSDAAGGRANDTVFNRLASWLHDRGYAELEDVVADVFEGRVTNERARLIHDPAHEEQPDGFGHYGWENGQGEKAT